MLVKGEEISVIDADTHVIEPANLWIDYLPAEFRDRAPEIRWDDENDCAMWFAGDKLIYPALKAAHSGWEEFAPLSPRNWDEVDPSTYDAKARLARMDEYGIHAQILYPNIAMFGADRQMKADDAAFQSLLIRAFNDWQYDWCSEAPDRLLPMASLPFWDLDGSIEEMVRCAERGFRGVVFSQNPGAFGLPPITDRHWDPLWARAQEMRIPINFHIGSGDFSFDALYSASEMGTHASYAARSVGYFMSNAQTITNLIFSGVCHRFPELPFVSVESGAGYIPFLLEAMDWQWMNSGVHKEHPEFDLLPSEYFKRQIYACFWFERDSVVHAVEKVGADNFLFETDFPHPTGQNPGPASYALPAHEYVTQGLDALSLEDLRKILHDNAARLYRLD